MLFLGKSQNMYLSKFPVLIILLLFLSGSISCFAQTQTEEELVNEIVVNLQKGDDSSYAAQFPELDKLEQLVYQYQPKDSFQLNRINKLKENIQYLRAFDPEFNPEIFGRFNFAREKASDSGIHWNDILISRFKLDKQMLPRELVGFELIAPLRMQGYIFIKDVLTRRLYCIAIRDIFLIDGKWYGGVILNILEAHTIPVYKQRLREEQEELRKMMVAKANGTLDNFLAVKDSIRESEMKLAYEEEEEEEETIFKDVVDRKLFSGYFDKEFGVELYIRYIKGGCPETICDWEAMYKFDDLDDYIFLDVERKQDGTFVMTEDEVGVMELKVIGNTLAGTWTSFRDKTEYEVYMKEEDGVKPKKLLKLDKFFEAYGGY